MLFFKPKPKEKFKYLPAFNSAKFFGEKKRKTELDFKPLVKVFRPSRLVEKVLIEKPELKGEIFVGQVEVINLRQFPIRLIGVVKQTFFDLSKAITIISTLKTFVIAVALSIFVLVGFLAFVDTNYIVTNWELEFSPDSYLDKAKSRELQKFLQIYRLGGVIPNNHLLFLDGGNMELTIKDKFPEITKIEVVQKTFPNKVKLRVSTEAVMATLIMKVNSKTEFWRVAKNGNIISRDNHNLLTNAVYVENDITYNKDEGSFDQTNFFGANLEQLDKLYMIEYVKELVTNFGLKIARVSVPSLSSADKNFTIWLDNQVKFIFNSSQFDKKSIEERVQKVLNSQLITQIKSAKIQYIDMRIAYRIYVG